MPSAPLQQFYRRPDIARHRQPIEVADQPPSRYQADLHPTDRRLLPRIHLQHDLAPIIAIPIRCDVLRIEGSTSNRDTKYHYIPIVHPSIACIRRKSAVYSNSNAASSHVRFTVYEYLTFVFRRLDSAPFSGIDSEDQVINFVLIDEMLCLEMIIYGSQYISAVCSEKSIFDGRARLLQAGERRISYILNTMVPIFIKSKDDHCIQLLLKLQDMFRDNLLEITALWSEWTPVKAIADLNGYKAAHTRQCFIAQYWLKSESKIIDMILSATGDANPQPIGLDLHSTIKLLASPLECHMLV